MRNFFVATVWRCLVQVAAAGAVLGLTGAAGAQPAYPNKPIRFVVPYPPGSGTDIVARLLGQKLTESWGQQVTIDNRPGAGAIIGVDVSPKPRPTATPSASPTPGRWRSIRRCIQSCPTTRCVISRR